MRRRGYRIPFVVPLDPGFLMAQRRDFEKGLGWPVKRFRYYYLARNGIWHGMDSLGVKPGDTVLMPAYHHGVEAETLLQRGIRLVYYRVDKTLQADLDHVQRLLTPGIRALYVIHYLGFPQPIRELSGLAEERGLPLIEDCALSLFSSAGGQPLGSFGDISIFCLYKSLPVPHGGMLILNRRELPLPPATKTPNWTSTAAYLSHRLLDALELRRGGRSGFAPVGLARRLGRTLKGTMNLQTVPIDTDRLDLSTLDLGVAPITRFLLDRFDPTLFVARRRDNFTALLAALDPAVQVAVRELPQGACPLSLPVLVPDKPRVQARLLEDGIQTVNFWSQWHANIPQEAFPEVSFLRRHLLEVPIHQELNREHMEYIAMFLNQHARW